MEKHKCKLCFRSFSNGRALGGHMRSHMMNHSAPPKPEGPNKLSEEAELASSSSSSEEEGGGGRDEIEKSLSYGLRENPKRSVRLVDPEFSFTVDAGSIVLQDRESETESSKNPNRKRSKRATKPGGSDDRFLNRSKTESLSSVSDTTTEEDVAFCLMMLSRDKWKRQRDQFEHEEREDDDEEQDEEEEDDDEEEERSSEESDESEELKSSNIRARGNYKCETCNKVFRSYQALGGHRASHKKIKVSSRANNETQLEQENVGTSASMGDKKVHECPVCFRVFSSGQALGGHKRTHVTGAAAAAATTPVRIPNKFGDNLIDLNLPAPIDDDQLSQIELSAVSDAEFVNPVRN